MITQTIEQIIISKDSIQTKLRQIDRSQVQVYGSESEYTYKRITDDVEELMIDISTLTSASDKFLKISSYDERSLIIQYLQRIDSFLETPIHYFPQYENLKIIIRNLNVRNFSERQLEFEQELENILNIKTDSQQNLNDIEDIKSEIKIKESEISTNLEAATLKLEEIESDLEVVLSQKNNLISQSEQLADTVKKLIEIKENADEQLIQITASMNESKANERLIASFANKVQERDNKLSELEIKTEENSTKLSNYEEERKSILREAKELIFSAKEALNYKTAEGISASFQEQYESANNKWIFGSWIIGALICLFTTIGLGIWIIESSATNDDLVFIIGRISLLPLPIIGTIFCANQYTKQKNIIEDYAYKMVLSKAIVGFSEQLKKHGSDTNEEYVHYIKTALKEIHRDPLRKRETQNKSKGVNTNLKEMVEIAEKIIKISKIE